MRDNECIKIIGTNVILVPYKEKHVKRLVSFTSYRLYHEWMKSAELQYFTGSESLTLEEEFQMQKRWHQDQDKKAIYTEGGNEIEAMIGDTNLFFNELDQPNTAEIEIMIANINCREKKRGWEAIILMMLYGIDKLNVTKYIAKIKCDNEKSIKMFEKLKFHKVKKNEIFQEYIFEKMVNQDWIIWLYSETSMNAITYGVYDKESDKKEKENKKTKLCRFEVEIVKRDKTNVMSLSKILQKLKNSMQKRPLFFNSIMYGSFYTGAEFTQQTYNRMFKVQMVGYVLQRQNYENCPHKSMSLMENKSNIFDECKAKFFQTFKTSCIYWLPVQFFNFLLVPPVLRVSFVSIAAFCWVNILCYLKNIPVSECNDNKIKY
ncbi:N-acetyltransferase 9 protein [Apis cerana cerana]|uniref:N-acetyltransferase 9 protein n=1 Tax=Apis cerana cerana TaxID=94128 RepID=A0A2A3E4X0_APICC|nr:N-acetyltransferase 9 protein [Apis cerana cerana]